MIKKCLICGKEFERKSTSNERWKKWKFCSRNCYYVYQKSHLSKTVFKKGQCSGKNNVNWKKDNVGYFALHSWINRQKGKPKICEHCGKTCQQTRLSWANKNHKYKRNINDYLSLCMSCHKKYDLENHLIKPVQRNAKGQFISN